jgi:hypothetical protein
MDMMKAYARWRRVCRRYECRGDEGELVTNKVRNDHRIWNFLVPRSLEIWELHWESSKTSHHLMAFSLHMKASAERIAFVM